MKAIKKTYEAILIVQIVFFIVYIIENIDDLDSIVYNIEFGEISTVITINLYYFIGGVAGLMLIVFLASFEFASTGFNEEGTKMLSKYIQLFSIYVVLGLGSSYYLNMLGNVGILIIFIITVIHALYGIDIISAED